MSGGVDAVMDVAVAEDFDPEAEIAREVLADTLGDSFSREDEELEARAWEVANGRPLKRDWWSWKQWRKYKRDFKGVRPARPYSMDPYSARQALNALMEKSEWNEHDKAEIVALCAMLDVKPPDFSKARITEAEAQAVSLDRFERIQSAELWNDRAKLVAKETDIGALHLVEARDAREEVRAIALSRIAELTVSRG